MQSKAADVAAYIEEAPPDRQTALARLRTLCLETLSGYEERMEYGMPVYARNGVGEVSFASQKQYISLYIPKMEVLDAHRDLLKGINMGKGCIRYRKPEQIDFDVVEKLLVGTRESAVAVC